MSHRAQQFALIAVLLAGGPAIAQPGGSIETPAFDPASATYTVGSSPLSQTDQRNLGISLTVAGNSELNYNWPFYRINGDSVQRPFGNYTKSDSFPINGTSNWPMFSGSTASYAWTEIGPSGTRFTANETLAISGGPGHDDVQLTQSLKVTNPGSSPLTISIYQAAVPNPDGSRIQSASGGAGSISVTNTIGRTITFSATGATAYQASSTDTALNTLLFGGAAADLNNSGLPISNFDTSQTGRLIELAQEWTATIPPNGSATFSSAITTTGIPEPSSFLLTAAAGVLVAARRRIFRRKRAATRETKVPHS